MPVYSGTLNLGLSGAADAHMDAGGMHRHEHGLGGVPVDRVSTPTLQRDVITNVISSLALDGDLEEPSRGGDYYNHKL